MVDVLSTSDLNLEEVCWHPRSDSNATNCPKCRGDGGYPTQFGEAVLAFVKKYGPVYELDATDKLYRTDAPPVGRYSDDD